MSLFHHDQFELHPVSGGVEIYCKSCGCYVGTFMEDDLLTNNTVTCPQCKISADIPVFYQEDAHKKDQLSLDDLFRNYGMKYSTAEEWGFEADDQADLKQIQDLIVKTILNQNKIPKQEIDSK